MCRYADERHAQPEQKKKEVRLMIRYQEMQAASSSAYLRI